MARSKKRVCTVTGMNTNESNFYRNQTHVKAVDNVRRLTGATNRQLTNLFNQLYTY